MANDVSYFQIEGNPTTYSFNDADAETKITQKVSKSGDTMTGGLIVTNNTPVTLQDTAITIGTAPSGTHTGAGIRFTDGAGTIFAAILPTYRSNGKYGIDIRTGFSGAAINLALLSDGTNIEVAVNSPSAWRTALSAVPSSRTINGYDLTENRSLTYSDVGALSATDTTVLHVGAIAYGDSGTTISTSLSRINITVSVPSGASLIGAIVCTSAGYANIFNYNIQDNSTIQVLVRNEGSGTITGSNINVRPIYRY